MQNKLKPCPLCGGSVMIALFGNEMHWLSITRSGEEDSCKCRLFLQSKLLYPDATCEEIEAARQELIERWNTRKPMERIVEQLEDSERKSFNKCREEIELFKEEYWRGNMNGFGKAIEIVRKGGVEDAE